MHEFYSGLFYFMRNWNKRGWNNAGRLIRIKQNRDWIEFGTLAPNFSPFAFFYNFNISLFQQHDLLICYPAQKLEGTEAHGKYFRVRVAEQFI
jgi:hypothetical protein